MKTETLLPDTAACAHKFKESFKTTSMLEINALFAETAILPYKKGEYIYRENTRITGCYFLYSGTVKIFQTGQRGKDQIIRFGKAGDMFGFRSVIRIEPACTSVETLADCVVCHIPNTSLLHTLAHSPEFAYEMMQIACKELGDANHYIRDIAQKPVKARLAEVLLLLANEFGLEEYGALRLNISREDLSNFVGTATETLIRLLSELRVNKTVDAKGRKIMLLNIPELKRLAES